MQIANLKSSQNSNRDKNPRTNLNRNNVSFQLRPGHKGYLGGNLKAYELLLDEATPCSIDTYISEFTKVISKLRDDVEGAIFPNGAHYGRFADKLGKANKVKKIKFEYGPQDFHLGGEASTGRSTFKMLQDLGDDVIPGETYLIGHSEVREMGETDEVINKKIRKVLDAGGKVVLCIGETLEDKNAGKTKSIIKNQLLKDLDGVTPEEMSKITIAYEPVYSIQKGKIMGIPCEPEDANVAIGYARRVVQSKYFNYYKEIGKDLKSARKLAKEVAENLTALFGGSVKPDYATKGRKISEYIGPTEFARKGKDGEFLRDKDGNIRKFKSQIDGGLVGSAFASIKAVKSFVESFNDATINAIKKLSNPQG